MEDKEMIIDKKDEEISFLKSKIEYWKDKFNKVLDFIRDKIFGRFSNKDSGLYKNMADNLYINNVINEKEYSSITNKKTKNRDDFEL